MTIEDIASICHTANRAYCWTIGDYSQQPWDHAPMWQRDSAINGVKYRLDNPGAPASAMHDAWLAEKLAAGWTYGQIKDAVNKIHPCMVPYDNLPEEQKRKDALFSAIVDALRS
jgi:hypothetical protein